MRHYCWIPHFALLGDKEDVQEIAAAVLKIQEQSAELQKS